MGAKWTAYEPRHGVSGIAEPSQLAHRMLSAKDSTALQILEHVARGPKQFKDLKTAIGKPDGQLTRALANLHKQGLLVERLHARTAPAYKAHELGLKGRLVVELIEAYHHSDEQVLKAAAKSKGSPAA